MFSTHGGKNIMVCLACSTLPCTPMCTGKGRTTPEMMWEMYICHITLIILTWELRRSDLAKRMFWRIHSSYGEHILQTYKLMWQRHICLFWWVRQGLTHTLTKHPLTWICKWQYRLYSNSTWFDKPFFIFLFVSS